MRRRVNISPNAYVGKSILPEKLKKIRKRLIYKPENAYVYVITVSPNPNELLDIYESAQLKMRYFRTFPRLVVGIASSRSEAFELVGQITLDCQKARGDYDLKEFLLC